MGRENRKTRKFRALFIQRKLPQKFQCTTLKRLRPPRDVPLLWKWLLLTSAMRASSSKLCGRCQLAGQASCNMADVRSRRRRAADCRSALRRRPSVPRRHWPAGRIRTTRPIPGLATRAIRKNQYPNDYDWGSADRVGQQNADVCDVAVNLLRLYDSDEITKKITRK